MPNYTPMMEQYFAIKNEYHYCLLMFRLGDFYEMFFDDALIATKELGLTLTGRDCGQAERAPMCGVPHHSVEGHIAKLVEKGYHVAICEQTEDARQAKGIVKREVVRVVTPGTVFNNLDESRHNFVVCVCQSGGYFGCATADITTGLFMVTALPDADENKLMDELSRLSPAELIVNEAFAFGKEAELTAGVKPSKAPAWTFHPGNAYNCLKEHFKTHHLEGFGLPSDAPEIPAAGALLQYLAETQKNALHQITAIKPYSPHTHMALDQPSRRNLELTASARGGSKKDTLLHVLDRTQTAMGARLLRNWVEQPLIAPSDITRRLDAVEELKVKALLRAELRELLSPVRDLERLMSRLASNNANGRDLNALKQSFKPLPHISTLIKELTAGINKEIYRTFDDLADLYARITETLLDEPPSGVHEGGMIRPGYDAELDTLLTAKNNGSAWLSDLEAREREQTGIRNLKVRYNKIFGYYIEITQSYLHLTPDRYIRRQTLANCERFVTDELKKLEETILSAGEKQMELEYTLFDALRREIVEQIARIQFVSYALSTLDALQSLAETAERNRYCKPAVNGGGRIYIKNGRHPVVEHKTPHPFVPNDTDIDSESRRMSVVTGPNMAGKSTYMRQVALIVLMAQVGSFVPADEAEIGAVDRIFTRVGASDDLATGQSTFMVEMTEVANILHNAGANSLILLDEIGRGTSTYDGLAIAWAALEYIAERIGAKTLFATHYHELTELEGRVPGVVNYSFTALEQGEDIVFLRKLVRGGADHSYGIHAARLAGLPNETLIRARAILAALNAADINEPGEAVGGASSHLSTTAGVEGGISIGAITAAEANAQCGVALLEAFRQIDINRITPLEAIMELDRMQKIVDAFQGLDCKDH